MPNVLIKKISVSTIPRYHPRFKERGEWGGWVEWRAKALPPIRSGFPDYGPDPDFLKKRLLQDNLVGWAIPAFKTSVT